MTDYGKEDRKSFLVSLYGEKKSTYHLWMDSIWPAVVWVAFLVLMIFAWPDIIAWFYGKGIVQ
jgi:hypothetical protein